MSLLTTMFESVAGLYRPAISRDASGGTVQTFGPVAAWQNVPCSCQQSSTMVRVLYAQQTSVNLTTVYFAQDIGAQKDDQLRITGQDKVQRKYNCLGPLQYVNRAKLWAVDVELISQPV